MNQLFRELSSLGCNLLFEPSETLPDPEQTIIKSLDFFWSDKKFFTMLIGLLCHRLHNLINTQRLATMGYDLNNDRKILLIIVCLKVAKITGDVRFQLVAKRLRMPGLKLQKCPAKYQDEFYIKRLGLDKEFKFFKVKVANFFKPAHEKKFKSIEMIYTNNLWLRLRALAGADYRADLIYLKSANRVSNQIEAANLIGCDKSSISRIWNSIMGFDQLTEQIGARPIMQNSLRK